MGRDPTSLIMSLKARLRISILALVATIVLGISVLNLHRTVEQSLRDAQERAQLLAQQVKTYVLESVQWRIAAIADPPVTLAHNKSAWYEAVRKDQALARVLQKTMSNSSFVVEAMILADDGTVLTGSDPARAGQKLGRTETFSDWQSQSLWERLWQIFNTQNRDYAVTVPLGVPGQPEAVMTIRLLVSSVLLREELAPHLRELAIVSTASLLLSALLAVLVSNLVNSSLQRLGRNIDLIESGDISRMLDESFESKEFADVQLKLTRLGKRYRGVQDDALNLRINIDQMLQRLEEAVLVFDPDGRLQMAGKPAERLLARNRDELVGEPVESIFPSRTPIGKAIQRALKLRAPIHDQPVTHDRVNLPQSKLLISVEFVNQYPERRLATMVTLKDAEMRREIESELGISQRLAAIGRITGGVAHEIKNPLNAIMLHLEILRAKLGPERRDLSRDMEVIARELMRLDRVVKTFLDFNRPLEPKMRLCNLLQICREVAELVAPQADSQNSRVECITDLDAAPILGDCDLLKQAVLNIVVNGIEAMKQPGSVRIRVNRSFDQFETCIEDQGEGIPPEVHDKIFTLYFSTKKEGTGIGLATAFRVVQLHNGSITFDSEPGKGTIFRIRFPVLHDELVRSVIA